MDAALEGVTKMIERKVDEEIEKADAELKALETMNDDELEALREKRREALKKAQDQKQVRCRWGPSYAEIYALRNI